jgi:hypothetical protein
LQSGSLVVCIIEAYIRNMECKILARGGAPMNDGDWARRREERRRLLERLNTLVEGAPYLPEADDPAHIREIEIERG